MNLSLIESHHRERESNTWSVVVSSTNKKSRFHIASLFHFSIERKRFLDIFLRIRCTQSAKTTGRKSDVFRQRWQVSENWSWVDDGFGDIWAGACSSRGEEPAPRRPVPSGASSPSTWRHFAAATVFPPHRWNSPLSVRDMAKIWTVNSFWDHSVPMDNGHITHYLRICIQLWLGIVDILDIKPTWWKAKSS